MELCRWLGRAGVLALVSYSFGAACSSSQSGPPGPRPMPDGDGPIEVTLHVNTAAAAGQTELVSFGVPFPRGALAEAEVSSLVVVDAGGEELPSHVEAILPWRLLGEANQGDGSVRVVRVHAEVPLAAEGTTGLTILRDAERTLELGPQDPPSSRWEMVEDDDYPVPLPEPRVYATFSPEWLGLGAVRTFTTRAGSDEKWAWFDDFFVGAAHTFANEVPVGMDRIDLEDNDPWLFDRPMSFYNVYVRTGDVKWLRHAHRAVRYYLTHLADGYFDLAPNHPDLKYSYGQSLLADVMFTGDDRLLASIGEVYDACDGWDPIYEADDNFWTERHQTYALLAALSAWEATGSPAYAERVQAIARASFELAKRPADGSWPSDGCMLHTLRSHEGAADDAPVCSPWMSALFADAVWRYWLHSSDDEALVFLGNLAAFIAEHGLYDGSYENVDYMVPWYLVSSVRDFTDSGPWADWEHSCDVAGLLVRGAYARHLLGEERGAIQDAANQLIESCQGLLEYWHRPGSDSKPEWRITPPRKYNWWFGTTSDLPWLVENAM